MRHKTVFIFRDGAYKFSQKWFFFTLRKRKLQLGELIGLASDEKDGLLQAGTFRYRGHQGDNGLDNIGSGYGYSYASDGSGVWGVFLSFNSDCRLQFKCSHVDGSLYTRTYNQMTKEWSKWRLL